MARQPNTDPRGEIPPAGDERPGHAGNGQARHRASYATDKRKGGYLIRVVGPDSNAFAGREVPVSTKAGGEPHLEKLVKVQWSGKDKESGDNVTLYTFEGRPRDQEQITW